MKKNISFIVFTLLIVHLHAQKTKPYPPVPARQQLAWHDLEFYLFVHFGPNTFTDKEWGHGDEPVEIFNPTNLDCRQWARIAQESGAKGIIITAKHHDGFCLWPSKYSGHTIRESKWRSGQGDVLKELSLACKEYGLKFGVYLSPWDRNHPQYGTPQYNDVFVNMMKEIFENYGPVWELWWDGANGEGPNGKKQVYDWKRFENTVRQISPNTVVFSDIGPDIRWVGNESGIAGKTNWNLLDTAGFTRGAGAPHIDTLNQGNVQGNFWIPGECDVSIRPGWFYHAHEDKKVKTAQQLFALYLKSVGRGANFLLNVPPDRRGRIHENDSASLVDFKKLRETNFKNNLVKNKKVQNISGYKFESTSLLTDQSLKTYAPISQEFRLNFQVPTEINSIVLQEAIEFGQRIESFEIVVESNGKNTSMKGTTIGRKRIMSFPIQKVTGIRVKILKSKAVPIINEIAAYKIDERLVEQ